MAPIRYVNETQNKIMNALGAGKRRKDLEGNTSKENSGLYGLLIGEDKNLHYILNETKPFENNDWNPKKVRRFPTSILSLHETPREIYVGTIGPVGENNLYELKSNLEKRIYKYGASTGIHSIAGNSKEDLLIGGDMKKFTDYEGNQLIDYKTLKDKNIQAIEEIIPDPNNKKGVYLKVIGDDDSNRIVKYNLANKKFENFLDLETGSTLIMSNTKLIKDKEFIHTVYSDENKLAINKDLIKGTKLENEAGKLKKYLSLENISLSQNENELYCVAGGIDIPLFEYKIDLDKKEVKDWQEVYNPSGTIQSLQAIRNKENHYWLMEQVNKNQKQG